MCTIFKLFCHLVSRGTVGTPNTFCVIKFGCQLYLQSNHKRPMRIKWSLVIPTTTPSAMKAMMPAFHISPTTPGPFLDFKKRFNPYCFPKWLASICLEISDSLLQINETHKNIWPCLFIFCKHAWLFDKRPLCRIPLEDNHLHKTFYVISKVVFFFFSSWWS